MELLAEIFNSTKELTHDSIKALAGIVLTLWIRTGLIAK